jgi:uncharacterized membrane protein
MRQANDLLVGRVLVLGAAVLLFVDTFAPWQHVSLDQSSYSWNAWHGDKGVLLGSLTAVLVVWAGVRALGVALPARVAETVITLALAVLVFAFAAVKNIHDDYSAWGSYVGVVIAGAVVAVAWHEYQRGSDAPVEDPVAVSVD